MSIEALREKDLFPISAAPVSVSSKFPPATVGFSGSLSISTSSSLSSSKAAEEKLISNKTLGFRFDPNFEPVLNPLLVFGCRDNELFDVSSWYHCSILAASSPPVAFSRGSLVSGITRDPSLTSSAISGFLFFFGLIKATFSSPDLMCLPCADACFPKVFVTSVVFSTNSVPKEDDVRKTSWFSESSVTKVVSIESGRLSPPSSFPPTKNLATAAAAVADSISSTGPFRFAAWRCSNCCLDFFQSALIPAIPVDG
mmetsp:Transcript_10340/g.11801  ORF Transcript_10340/g.11801 Transcript_10340/m.11801 type:complete len:255 (+) Transcript_10340:5306-6070(+)